MSMNELDCLSSTFTMEFLDSFSAYWSQMPFLVLSCNFLAQVTTIKGLVNTSCTQQEITRGKSVWPENLVSYVFLEVQKVFRPMLV